MFQKVFLDEDFGYCYDKNNNSYLLISKKYKDRLILKKDEALLFSRHIDVIISNLDEANKQKIKNIIASMFLYKNNSLDNSIIYKN